MARDSIFHKLANDENSFTELLCNFLWRDEFRSAVLPSFMPAPFASRVNAHQITTQFVSEDCGRPDIKIETSDVFVLIEIKLNPKRGLTAHQDSSACDTGDTRRYLDLLQDCRTAHKALIFLAPANWIHRDQVDPEITDIRNGNTTIEVRLCFWEDVLDAIRGNGDPLIQEFKKVLMRQLTLIHLENEELTAIHATGFETAMRATRKLQVITDRLAELENRAGRVKPEWEKTETQSYGFYAEIGRKCSLWFGLWEVKQRAQLCYALKPTCGDESRAAFRSFFANTQDEDDGSGGKWLVAPVPDELLQDRDPVGKIRRQFDSLLDRLAPELVSLR